MTKSPHSSGRLLTTACAKPPATSSTTRPSSPSSRCWVITLSPKNRKELLAQTTWQTQRDIMQAAQQIAAKVGTDEHLDFNLFETMMDEAFSTLKLKLSTAERTKSKTPTASSVIHEYFIREVRPHVDEAWIALDKTVIGYEISFNKYFYQHKPLRSLEDVTREILALEAETDGLLKQLVSFVGVKP